MAINGSSNSDLIQLSVEELQDEVVRGKAGFDTLALTSNNDYEFNRDSYHRLHGIEEINFEGMSGALSIQVKGSMLRQAGNNVLTMTFGDTGPIELEAKAYNGGALVIDGTGTISLSDNVENTVRLADNSQLDVRGGAEADTIIAGDGGMILDGGGGNDTLVAGTGSGADTIRFGMNDGADTISNFNLAEDLVALEGFFIPQLSDLLAVGQQVGDDTVFDFGNGDSLTLEKVTLSNLTTDHFSLDGEAIPTGPVVIALGTDAAMLNALILNAANGTEFVLAAGNHVFDQAIVIDRDDISIRGEADSQTTVTFAYETGTGGDGFIVSGNGDQFAGMLSQESIVGETTLTLKEGHGFTAGDAIYVQQPNDQAYLDANGWTNVSLEEAASRPFRESIHIIEAVIGNVVTLATPLSYSLEAGLGRYYTMDLTTGVSLSDFTITSDLGTSDSYDFSNTHLEFDGAAALKLENTSGISISNLDFVDVPSTALLLSSTIGATVDTITIVGAHNKGGNGNGYGVELHEAFDNTLTNLEIFDMRHSVILSAWHGETNNTIHISSTNRDVNLHGSPDHSNTIAVDQAILDYDIDNDGSAWAILSHGGTNHASTEFSENDVSFGVGIGSVKNELLTAADSGGILDGGFGYDTLIGGSSADVLIGGTRRDTMTGGEGSDTFLLVMGDDLDVITDFEFGLGGDNLIFSNNADVTSADDLTIGQYGDDVRVRYGSNSTVILENTDLANVDADNFEFDPNGTLSVEDYLLV